MKPGDLIALGIQGVLIFRLLQKQDIPPIPSPLADVTYEGLMGPRKTLLRAIPSIDVTGALPLPQTTANSTATSCIACTKHHLAGVAAMLNEATRFTRSGTPISDPEVQERLAIAEEEIAAWERKDVTPAQIAASPPEERQLILDTVEKVRALRHFIDSSRLGMGKGTPENLEQAAAMASHIRQEFRGHLVEMGQEGTEAETPKNPGNPGHENPGEPVYEFIRLATKAELVNPSATRFMSKLPDRPGWETVYMPYGAQGRGYYYESYRFPTVRPPGEIRSDLMKVSSGELPASMTRELNAELWESLRQVGEAARAAQPIPEGPIAAEADSPANPGPKNPGGSTPPTLREMILAKTYPGAPEGIRLTEFPTQSYNRPEKFALYSTSTGSYYGKPWDTFEEAVAAANRENIRMYGREPLPVAAPEGKRKAAPKSKTFDQSLREQLKEREAKRFKSANDEIQIERLKATLAADPSRWQVGQGVGWKVARGQVNRGYQIEAILPETKEAIIRPVGDIGQLADYTGQAQRVDIIDLLRDKKYDTSPKEFKSNPGHENPSSKEPWQMTQAEFISIYQRRHRASMSNQAYSRLDEGDLAAVKAEAVDYQRHTVEQAIRVGKPVPPEVLADYPDLAAQYEQPHPEHPGHNPHG